MHYPKVLITLNRAIHCRDASGAPHKAHAFVGKRINPLNSKGDPIFDVSEVISQEGNVTVFEKPVEISILRNLIVATQEVGK